MHERVSKLSSVLWAYGSMSLRYLRMPLTSTASAPVNCSSSTSASCCCSSQLFDETAGAAPRPTGSSNIRARSAGSGVGAAGCVAGAPKGAARVSGGACVAVFPSSVPESSEEPEGWQEYAEEVALVEEEIMALLAFNCPPNRFANAAAQ